MYELLKLFYQIALLRKSPEDIPRTPFLHLLVLVSYIGTSFLMLFISTTWTQAFVQLGVELLFISLFCRFILSWRQKQTRYPQTLTALIGVNTVITVCSFPAVASLNVPMPEESSFYLLAVFGFTLIILWHWIAAGHIFRKALSEPFIFGLGVSLLYLMLSYQLNSLLFY
jgi:hypothetical protein